MTTKERYTGIQSLFQICGREGCLLLSLASIIEEVNQHPVDIIDLIKTSLQKGWLKDNFYVNDSLAILNYYTNKIWHRCKVDSLPELSPNDYTIAIYYNKRTGLTHYRRRSFDTLSSSITVREGHISSYYIYSWS